MAESTPKTDWIVNRVIEGLLWIFLRLPYRTRVRGFGALIAYVVAPLAGFHRRAKRHVAYVWPELDASQHRQIARNCCDNLGRTMIENYSGPEFQAHVETCTLRGDGLVAIAAAREAGQPVLFFTGHFGNFEAPRRALTAQGFEIGGIYRKMNNDYFNAHYEQTMMDVSGPVFAQGREGVLKFFRHLKKGGMATILIDVRTPGHGDIDFLGKPAPTATSAAQFALKANALLVPYFGIRAKDGIGFVIEVQQPIPHTDEHTMTIEATKRLENMVVNHPGQWFWVHRRWRKAKGLLS